MTSMLPNQVCPLSFSGSKDSDAREGFYRNLSTTDMAMLTEAFSKTNMDPNTMSLYQREQNYGNSHSQSGASQLDARSTTGMGTVPVLIPMQASGDGLPLTSVVETLASKGSRAAAENPETVAHAWKLRQWGIG